MPVTVIEQQMKAARRVDLLLRVLMSLSGGKFSVSSGPYPHDALELKPNGLEKEYDVTITRLRFDDLPTEWPDREAWQPLCVKRNMSTQSKRIIYYYHGSGFINTIPPLHWKFLGRLIHELDADVIIQTYTMVPYAGIHDNIPKMTAIYQRVHGIARANKQELILGGDSAGGTISLAILLAAHDAGIPLPDQVLLIAPVMTTDIDTPENRAIDPVDCFLSVDQYVRIMRAWATGPIDPDLIYRKADSVTEHEKTMMQHPYASPIYGDWTFLKTANLPVTLVQGTHDILYPQVKQWVQKAKDLDLNLTYIEAARACHIYPILCVFPGASWLAPDSNEGLRLVVDSVLKHSKY